MSERKYTPKEFEKLIDGLKHVKGEYHYTFKGVDLNLRGYPINGDKQQLLLAICNVLADRVQQFVAQGFEALFKD